MRIRLSDYEIDTERPIGEGAMGIVYLGRDPASGEISAVKILRPGLSDGEENRARFFREARILTEVKSPNLVPVYSSGESEGRLYLAMEYVDGAGLNRLLASSAGSLVPIGVAVDIALQVARGLAAAHARGVVHRDVKPGNILVNREGRAKVMDLGVAQWAEEAALTLTGESHGTPAYMSPEQAAAAGRVSAASDVYNLGAVLYQVLTGAPPFVGPTAAVLNGHMNLEPIHPADRRPDVPEALGDLVMQFLEKDPTARPADPVAALEGLGLASGEEAVRIWMESVLSGADALAPDAPALTGTPATTPARLAPARPPRARRRGQARSSPPGVRRWLGRWPSWPFESRPLAAAGGAAGALLIVVALLGTIVSRFAALRHTVTAAGLSDGMELGSGNGADFDPRHLPAGWVYGGLNEQGFHEVVRPADLGVMIWVPEGDFLMGSPLGKGEDVERPQRRIHLSGYLIDRDEVTWDRYLAFCQTTGRPAPARPPWAAGDHPVVGVSWDDAAAYAEWAGCRLPTEAQWEKAARGEDGREYCWGDRGPYQSGRHYANYSPNVEDADGFTRTSPVGSFDWASSPYGCLDMAGNVWEWCRDWYDGNAYGIASDRDPEGPEQGVARVMRGGSWLHGPRLLRAAQRGSAGPEWSADHLGFRCSASR